MFLRSIDIHCSYGRRHPLFLLATFNVPTVEDIHCSYGRRHPLFLRVQDTKLNEVKQIDGKVSI